MASVPSYLMGLMQYGLEKREKTPLRGVWHRWLGLGPLPMASRWSTHNAAATSVKEEDNAKGQFCHLVRQKMENIKKKKIKL
jgi:hypothetical protein